MLPLNQKMSGSQQILLKLNQMERWGPETCIISTVALCNQIWWSCRNNEGRCAAVIWKMFEHFPNFHKKATASQAQSRREPEKSKHTRRGLSHFCIFTTVLCSVDSIGAQVNLFIPCQHALWLMQVSEWMHLAGFGVTHLERHDLYTWCLLIIQKSHREENNLIHRPDSWLTAGSFLSFLSNNYMILLNKSYWWLPAVSTNDASAAYKMEPKENTSSCFAIPEAFSAAETEKNKQN